MGFTRRALFEIFAAAMAGIGFKKGDVVTGDDGQPLPLRARRVVFGVGSKVVTAVMRHWRPGDSGPNGRCKLCPTCRAYEDACLIVINREVPRGEISLLSIRGTIENATGTLKV